MRSSIKILLLVLLHNVSWGQTAALTINNVQNPCNLYVDMNASTSADGMCSVKGNTLFIAAGTSVSFTDYYDFQTRVGWGYASAGPFASVPPYIDFKWTEIDFQESCPAYFILPCVSVGGYVNTGTEFCGALAQPNWTGACRNAQWTPAYVTAYLTNVEILFY